jgi:hypothetical protein
MQYMTSMWKHHSDRITTSVIMFPQLFGIITKETFSRTIFLSKFLIKTKLFNVYDRKSVY